MSIISACDKAGGVYRCTYITLPLADISYAGEVIRRSEASQVGTLTLVDCEKKHKSHVSSAARGGKELHPSYHKTATRENKCRNTFSALTNPAHS